MEGMDCFEDAEGAMAYSLKSGRKGCAGSVDPTALECPVDGSGCQ